MRGLSLGFLFIFFIIVYYFEFYKLFIKDIEISDFRRDILYYLSKLKKNLVFWFVELLILFSF